MKKKWFIVLYIVIGLVTAFGQNAVGASADSEIVTEQAATTDRDQADGAVVPAQATGAEALSSQENTAVMPKNDVPASVSADNGGAHELLPAALPAESDPAEPAAYTDAGVTEPKSSSAPQENAKNESTGTETVIVTGSDNKAQEQKDIVQSAEMNEPTQRTKRRPISMHSGLLFDVIGANNAFDFFDFFKPELVIDFNKLSQKTIKSGFHAGALFNFDWFFQFTVLEEHTVKLSTTVNVDGWTNVSKSLLDLIAKGNEANADGKAIKGAVNAKLNAFADTGILYQLKKPNYGFSARLAYFIPLAYMENPQATVTLSPKKNGEHIEGLIMEAEGTANIYGYLPAMAARRGISVPELLKNGGLDLSLGGSYSPTKWVTVTGGVNYLPLMVVQMNTGLQSHFKFEGSVDNLLSAIGDKNKEIFTQNMKMDELSDKLPQKKIMRPCKIQIGADFRPFQNDYLILSPSFAFPVINAKPYYVDGGLKIESRFAKVLGVYLDIGCIERMWRHELCFFIASRGFTLNLAASVASQDFRRTFTTLSGVGVKLGVGIGF